MYECFLKILYENFEIWPRLKFDKTLNVANLKTVEDTVKKKKSRNAFIKDKKYFEQHKSHYYLK